MKLCLYFLYNFILILDMNNSTNATDHIFDNGWNIGAEFSRPGLWLYYSIGNYFGAMLNILLMYVLNKSYHIGMTPSKVGISGLCSGCALMSIPCATQCFINLISYIIDGKTYFRFGINACFWEAFFHISAIIVQFFSIMLNGIIVYLGCVKQYIISVFWSRILLVLIWIIAEIGTYIFATHSKFGLLPSGAYCFNYFNSPMIVYWFVPLMIIALGVLLFCYISIFLKARDSDRRFLRENSESISIQMAKKTSIYFFNFLFGWIFAVIACISALVTGNITETQDVLVGLFGTFHSIAVPLLYGFDSKDVHKWFYKQCGCRKYCNNYLIEKRNMQTIIKTRVTLDNSMRIYKDNYTKKPLDPVIEMSPVINENNEILTGRESDKESKITNNSSLNIPNNNGNISSREINRTSPNHTSCAKIGECNNSGTPTNIANTTTPGSLEIVTTASILYSDLNSSNRIRTVEEQIIHNSPNL